MNPGDMLYTKTRSIYRVLNSCRLGQFLHQNPLLPPPGVDAVPSLVCLSVDWALDEFTTHQLHDHDQLGGLFALLAHVFLYPGRWRIYARVGG